MGTSFAEVSWDQTFPASARFTVLGGLANEAVLDRETGLVWERAPNSCVLSFQDAIRRAQHLRTGGRMGWRMPRVEELFSLLDPAQINSGGQPALPIGHPFAGTISGLFWVRDRGDAPPQDDSGALALAIDAALLQFVSPSMKAHVWCTRGPA